MLVLSRKEGESIEIGAVRVTVLRIGGGKVRIGVTAEAVVPIRRTELAPRTDARGGELRTDAGRKAAG